MGKANQRPQARAQQDDSLHYPLPNDTRQAFERLNNQQPTNLGLVFDRFAPDWSQDPTLKKEALNAVRAKAAAFNAKPAQLHLQALRWRWQLCVEAANGKPFALSTEWRFVAGLGRKGALEVGFTFNRHGVPILPGSSVKGIARAAARYAGFAEDHPDVVAVFGRASSSDDEDNAQAGGAVFFDAIPHRVNLDLDVMNPHFPDYYRGEDPPAAWQSPVPVYFLTVAPGVPFWFAVGWRGALDAHAQRLRQQAEDWLRLGLTTLGAGAKTNAGYGFFTPAPPDIQPLQPTPELIAEAPIAPPAPAALTLQIGEGKLRREGDRAFILPTGSQQRIPLDKKRVDFQQLPADSAPVRYEFYVDPSGRTVVTSVKPKADTSSLEQIQRQRRKK